jgi:hypothetical protein
MMNNGKNTIDDQIRAALEHFEQPYNAEHWQAMTAQLDALNAADASFDASLRGRLADISAVPAADAWSKMAEKLDNLDATDSSFDAALRGRLADVSAAPKMGDWSKMAAALDSFDDTESEFDEVLRRKLENIAGTHPNHWAMMNERLDREFTLRGKIVRYKIVEVALMLLTWFTVVNTLDKYAYFEASETSLLGAKQENQELKAATPENSTKNKNGAVETITPTFKTTTPQSSNGVKSFDNSGNWRERGGIQYKNGKNKEQNEQNTRQNGQPNQQPSVTPLGPPVVDNSLRNGVNTEGGNVKNNLPIVDNSLKNGVNTEGGNVKNNPTQNVYVATVPNAVSAENQGVTNNNVAAAATNQVVVDVVPTLDVLQANLLENNKLDATLNIIKPNADKKAKWRISAFGTAALDWVTTSFVDKYRDQHFQKQGVGNVGINALVSYQRGKVEVETGLMVNQKKYSIANAKTITGSFFRSYEVKEPDKLRLSIVSIPLNVNVKLKEKRRWNVYAHTGIAANAIVDAFDSGLKSKTLDVAPSNAPAPDPTEVETAVYSKGLLNGGETNKNVFWTAQVGLGVEYKLTPKTSLFLQPTAGFMLDKLHGIGSLNDRLQTYAIQGGAKWRL